METIPGETLRIIDANLNRIGEGLRFLEEIARLALDDAGLSQRLKTMRHEAVRCPWPQAQLLSARDSEGDVGASMNVPGEEGQRDIPEAVVANARRVQESLRVMEEIAKLPELGLEAEKYRKARFALYTLEKDLLFGVLRADKLQRLTGLYVIIDTAFLKGCRHAEAARQAILGGARVIQLRDKTLGKKELLPVANELHEVCAAEGALFIVNDYPDIAIAADADGLHIGQEDLPVSVARRLLPSDKILGCSARTVEKAVTARDGGADYLGVGAMFPTATHEKTVVIGPAGLEEIAKAVDLPLVAIGGIKAENVKQVMEAGATAIAVISAVTGADDIEAAARRLSGLIEGE
jgi:thiamine-phosphate pyrophosphorylase